MVSQTLEPDRPFAVALDLNSVRLTDDQFYQLCRDNEDLRLELTAGGELIITAPTGGTTGLELLDNRVTVSGDPVLTGFALDLKDIW